MANKNPTIPKTEATEYTPPEEQDEAEALEEEEEQESETPEQGDHEEAGEGKEKPRKKRVVIRKGTAYDVVNIARSIEDNIEEAEEPISPDPAMIVDWVNRVLQHGTIFVADLSGRIVGSIGTTPIKVPWSESGATGTEWFYVQPKFREAGTSNALLGALEKWAGKKKSPVILGLGKPLNNEMSEEDIEERGYQLANVTYVQTRR